MSYITLNTKKLAQNYDFLNHLFDRHEIEWAIVAKLLCGNEIFLKSLLSVTDTDICDSRLSNLKKIKELSPETKTVYIKPPAKRLAASIVKYADVSFNSEIETIKALSEEAFKQNKIHRIVIMIEMGELREGIMADSLPDFYAEVLKFPNIEVSGIGTNLKCLNGILPDREKLSRLVNYRRNTEKLFKKKIPYISAGSSVTIPLISKGNIPDGINHFRVGESLFFGTDVFNDTYIKGMHKDVFTLTAEVIEMIEKPMVPTGKVGKNLTGESPEYDEKDRGKTSVRAIVDLGVLDIDVKQVYPLSEGIEVLGASSDMMILNITDDKNNLKVGDEINFGVSYLAVLRAMNSDYVDKKVVNSIKIKNRSEKAEV